MEFCTSNGWNMASFQSDTDINNAKEKIKCNVYLGATSDGNGNWEWVDNSPWWAYNRNDGLRGETETKMVWRSNNKQWNDWGKENEKAT